MVYGLGSNTYGQLELGHNTSIETPVEVPQLCHQNIHQFINGMDFVLAVNTDNNVIFSFGHNSEGQLGRRVGSKVRTVLSYIIKISPRGVMDRCLYGESSGRLFQNDPNYCTIDLKPDNVLISMDGRIKLCDFGLAKEVHNCDEYNMSKAKHTADVGTIKYMAPEVNSDPIDYNQLTDIYSLSLIGAQIFGFDTDDIKHGIYQYI
ncbi:unnamed protein product [Oppiella nova]|uniref:Protein kinase domain-containing protein n=1 Tax=Oppiella nova TaxID=334625 RepID=A0A7R9QDZ9_9ACAR|nr:unnamed protein product [Oppiella nova]CAG2163891.1 unnamed protein product [Oppiella nova]